jgi:hypothetical protein
MEHKVTSFSQFVPALFVCEVALNQIKELLGLRQVIEMLVLFVIGERADRTANLVTCCQQILDNVTCYISRGTRHQNRLCGVFY